MIVVDTNVIAYLCIGGDQATTAEDVLMKDSEWHAPLLWRSEFRNVVAGFLRRGAFDLGQAEQIVAESEVLFFNREHLVSSSDVMRLLDRSPCTAYDCELVALAERLEIPLVTNDRMVLDSFPRIARSMRRFLGTRAKPKSSSKSVGALAIQRTPHRNEANEPLFEFFTEFDKQLKVGTKLYWVRQVLGEPQFGVGRELWSYWAGRPHQFYFIEFEANAVVRKGLHDLRYLLGGASLSGLSTVRRASASSGWHG